MLKVVLSVFAVALVTFALIAVGSDDYSLASPRQSGQAFGVFLFLFLSGAVAAMIVRALRRRSGDRHAGGFSGAVSVIIFGLLIFVGATH